MVAGLAAQSLLGNVFAGIQIAFSDAIRLDDVVIVEDEWGWIEEITLTYVVVRLWDDRRLVLPSTYFTTTPFQNWTRHSSALPGSVELDVDWRVDPDGVRRQLDVALATTDLWDGRAKVLQVTDAVGGWVRVRALVTARGRGPRSSTCAATSASTWSAGSVTTVPAYPASGWPSSTPTGG